MNGAQGWGRIITMVLQRTAANGRKVWECFILGVDPTKVITRMADPKVGGCYCVKSEYAPPPELEYFGYANMLDDDCEAWQQPSVEEVNAMLKSVIGLDRL